MDRDELRMIGIDLAVHRALERRRRSFDESENDILRRLLLPAARRPEPARGAQGGARARGLWTVEIGGERFPAANLKHAYRLLLCRLDAAHPRFLEAFAEQGGRGRRYVSATPAGLYPRSPHLARAHAQPLAAGWYFDSNVSSAQVAARARIAARLCGLFYGQDVRILDNLREI